VHKTTVTTASGNRYTVLLSAAIVEELELIWVCCRWHVEKYYNIITMHGPMNIKHILVLSYKLTFILLQTS
jgi:hypothetical protein